MVLLRGLGAAEYANTTNEGIENFCAKSGFRYKAVLEARKLRVQLTNQLNLTIPDADLSVDPRMPPPTDAQVVLKVFIYVESIQSKNVGGELVSSHWRSFIIFLSRSIHLSRYFLHFHSICSSGTPIKTINCELWNSILILNRLHEQLVKLIWDSRLDN